MLKTFKYYRTTGACYDKNGEWDGDLGYDFEYTPDSRDLKDALVSVMTEYYFGAIIKKFPPIEKDLMACVKRVIDENDFDDDLLDAFEEELKDWFRDEALDSENND